MSGVRCQGSVVTILFSSFSDKVFGLVGGGSVIKGAYTVYLTHHVLLQIEEIKYKNGE